MYQSRKRKILRMKSPTKKITAGMALLVALAIFAPKVKAVNPVLVQVANTLAQWIPTGSIDEAGRNPVQFPAEVTVDSTAVNPYTPPANYRLVIKNISARCYTQTPVVWGSLQLTMNGTDFGPVFPMTQTTFTPTNSFPLSIASVPVQYYADPGTPVYVGFISNGAWGEGGDCKAFISGYLVSLAAPAS
jgi:hypothetical protein